MTPAGQLKLRIVFERNIAARTAMGGPATPSWGAIGLPRLAKVLYGTGAERRATAGEQAVKAATFRLRRDSVTSIVTHKDRIVFNGLAWDITDISPIGAPSPTDIEFTATASRD